MEKDFEQLEHTADLQIRVYGTSISELFKNALIGMFQIIRPVTDACTFVNNRLECPELPVKREIELSAPSLDILLVDFLSDALYYSDINNEAYLDADVIYEKKDDEHTISATIQGIKITGFDEVEIKAVTYHELEIKETKEGFRVDIVFDI